MNVMRKAAAALLVALAACTDAGVRNIAAPDDVQPLGYVASVQICCGGQFYKGTYTNMFVTAYDQHGNVIQNPNVYWSSSNTSVAWAGSFGYVEMVGVGYAHIWATVDGVSNSVLVQVIERPVVTTVTVTPSPVSVQVGKSQQVTAKAYDQNGNLMSGKTATWSIDHSSVASVSSSGSVQGVAVGSTTVRATIDGVTGTASVSVSPALHVSLSGTSMITSAGTYSWTASASGGNGSFSYQWEVDWNDTPFEGFIPIDTGNPFYMNVDGCDGSFEVRVRVTSGASVTYASGHFVENYASCW